MIVFALMVVILILAVTAAPPREPFSDNQQLQEKRKNIISYFDSTYSRSPVGTWSQQDDAGWTKAMAAHETSQPANHALDQIVDALTTDP